VDWSSSLNTGLPASFPSWHLDCHSWRAIFRKKLHGYFNPSKAKIAQWYTTWDFRAPVHITAIYLLSGNVHRLQRALAVLADCQRAIVTVDWPRRSASRPSLLKALKAGHDLLSDFGLLPLVIANLAAGEVTDAQHIFGLGRNLHSSATPRVVLGLPRTLRHVLDRGTEGRF
jgi:hypothetical protein